MKNKSLSVLSRFLGLLDGLGTSEEELKKLSEESFVFNIKCVLSGLQTFSGDIVIPEVVAKCRIKNTEDIDAYYSHPRGRVWDQSLLRVMNFLSDPLVAEESVGKMLKIDHHAFHRLGFSHMDFCMFHPFLINDYLRGGKKVIFPAAIDEEERYVFYLTISQGCMQLLIKDLSEPLRTDEVLLYYSNE